MENTENLAPIVLFVYNRPAHTQKVVEALQKNKEAKHSDLFIFSDAPKNENANEKVSQVRSYIKTITGFKAITIKEQAQNQGLAKSIVNGVTEVVNRFGKIIVLEDDIETSPYFLKFMNKTLQFYETEKRIWSITGFSYPIKHAELPEAFCYFAISAWGWGTWEDRWKHFDKNPNKYISLISTPEDIHHFNFYGTADRYWKFMANRTGELNTWALFWYAVQFVNNGLQIMPAKPLSKNIGMDNSGVHCEAVSIFDCDFSENEIEFDFNKIPIEENRLATKLICDFFRKHRSNLSDKKVR